MSQEHSKSTDRPSAEFWTIIGTSIAMGALILTVMLTVSGWLRDDIRDLDIGLDALHGEVNALHVDVRGLDSRVEILDNKMIVLDDNVRVLNDKVRALDRRLAVIESHVLGIAAAPRNDEDA